MIARERIQQQTELWFLTEPLLFAVYCTHKLTMKPNMQCVFRTGQGRIEYNPALIDNLSNIALGNLLKVELVRILLGHPYARRPLGCRSIVLKMASDMVIAPAYNLTWVGLTHPNDLGLPTGQHFEWYANRLNYMGINLDGLACGEDNSCTKGEKKEGGAAFLSYSSEKQGGASKGRGNGNNKKKGKLNANIDKTSLGGTCSKESFEQVGAALSHEYTLLWEENAFMRQQVTDIIHSTTQWGSLPGKMVELIKKAAEGRIDYRNALRGFRASILSEKRRLTRMRPSRRFGFDQMGSRYEFTTRLLVAIDTSSSVDSENLERYYRIITTFFKYGIREIKVLMFDEDVKGEPITLREEQKKKTIEITGRGGTNFQAPIDYVVEHPEYDGLIIFTDGYAATPDVSALMRTKILWVIDNDRSYKRCYDSLRQTGRVCLMLL